MVELREGSALLHLMRSGPHWSGRQGSRLAARGSRSPRGQDAAAPRETGKGAGADRSPGTVAPTANERPAASREPTTTCGFCGQAFVEDRTQAACQACPLGKGCGLLRCPHCGYENAREPTWLVKLKEWIR